jgi:hypothetical protein
MAWIEVETRRILTSKCACSWIINSYFAHTLPVTIIHLYVTNKRVLVNIFSHIFTFPTYFGEHSLSSALHVLYTFLIFNLLHLHISSYTQCPECLHSLLTYDTPSHSLIGLNCYGCVIRFSCNTWCFDGLMTVGWTTETGKRIKNIFL